MRDHPNRSAVRNEVHARPVVLVPSACRLRRLVFLPEHDAPKVSDILATLGAWCAERGLPTPEAHTRQHTIARQDHGEFTVTFEFHNEFVTVTWSSAPGDTETMPEDIGLEIVADLPLISASLIDVLDIGTVPAEALEIRSLPSLCHVRIESGRADIATDLVEDADGFVHFEFAAKALTQLRRSIVARRLFEIETYSRLALLGLPPARAVGPDLNAIENEVSELLNSLPGIDDVAEARTAITALNALAQQVMVLNDRLNYRIAASQAYGEIVSDRLRTLSDQATEAGSNLSVYLENRVGPALRTLAATEKRLQSATRRIERAAMMLNARNGLELEIQNREILGTISRTGRSQFRLQQTVEGLSVIAITYYLVAVLGYALAGPVQETLNWDKEWLMAVLTPIAFVAVVVASRFLWRGHSKE